MGVTVAGVCIDSAMSVLPGRSPIVGQPSTAERVHEGLSEVAELTGSYVLHLEQALHGLMFIASEAADALSEQTRGGLLVGAKQFEEDLAVAERAFKKYANAIDRVHTSARSIIEETEAELQLIRVSANGIETAAHALDLPSWSYPSVWSSAPSLSPPRGPHDDSGAVWEWQRRAFTWGGAVDRIEGLRRRWSTAIADREAAEQTLVNTLNGTSIGQLLQALDGNLPVSTLTWVLTGVPPDPDSYGEYADLARLIFDEDLTPEELATRWDELGYSADEIDRLPIELTLALAGLSGVPAAVQDVASRRGLEHAKQHPESAYRLLGFDQTGTSLSEFSSEIADLERELGKAEDTAKMLKPQPELQLIGFGRHEGRVTAGFSMGDLDTATHVGINVSGMNSSVRDMGDSFPGATNIYQSARGYDIGNDYAIVHWIGYESPNEASVFGTGKATAGGERLARMIDGIYGQREVSGNPIVNTAIYAHSYGSTTAAEALKLTNHTVDHFVTYGSAGLEASTTADGLNVTHIHATHASGDQIAGIGLNGSGRIDPRDLANVNEFSAEAEHGFDRVTMHGMYAEEGSWSLVNWTKTGYLSEGTQSVDYMGNVLSGGVE